jgi:hypothetical protein
MEEDDIEAAMGFSSFGGTKKRKFEHSPKAKVGASGANSTQLGVRPRIFKAEGDREDASQELSHPGGEDGTVVESTEVVQPPTTNSKGKLKQPAATGLGDFLARGQNLPDKPNPGKQDTQSNHPEADPSFMVSFGGPSITRAELSALRQGVKNERGDTAYFLPSFVEDPWEQLKQNRG